MPSGNDTGLTESWLAAVAQIVGLLNGLGTVSAMSAAFPSLLLAAVAISSRASGAESPNPASSNRPNIVFILSDDLGYGELGCYGQKLIQTPRIDRMAAEGVRFTDCYAGCTVCAPSRCTLMTGLHTGHCRIRGNAAVPLLPDDVTVAKVLHAAGYATGIIGKWGLGGPDSSGIPNQQGFDYWLGYLDQVHAHNYYPDYLWRNEQKVPLPNVVIKGVATKRVVYSHDLFAAEALEFVERHKSEPFFLYLAFTIPHANNEAFKAGQDGMEVPDDKPYSDRDWPRVEKNKAAMITRMDADVGRLLDKLKALGLDERTIVFFTSDNGPHKEGGVDPAFFRAGGPLRGTKRDLYDGGIREPMIVRWPGRIAPGQTSDFVWAFWDFLPTAAELAGVKRPSGLDGISVDPVLLAPPGKAANVPPHEFLYWEFHEGGFLQAARMGRWKAVRTKLDRPLELYDLPADPGEATNLAEKHPEIVARIEAYLKTARTDSPQWPVQIVPKKSGAPN
ncbi:MAG TPA: arylsulfatase [Pirellulales bacterium]|jgi:arylsulfatase A-like enzyme|nr:arylsulfatase [Pirellulales bacterium]